jgi:DNA polymerase I-like protein with 3'-5' exonuclease and polymerase domains
MPIRTKDAEDFFICCDWISADIRVAAAISGDEELNESFIKSDPYTAMAEGLDLPRKECKIAFLKSIYSLDVESPILELFPTLHKWMVGQIAEMRAKRTLSTPLGRPFKLDSRDEKSVFNAVLQGTVAHAMQSSLCQMEHARDHLLAETHDSIIFSCRRGLIPHIVKAATDAMLRPLEKLPRFPLRVYIGKAWKKWKLYKEFR